MTFDSAAYWRKRGQVYERDFKPERYREQERALVDLLRGLDFTSVLDVGCGFGRIGELVMEIRPDAKYVGIDVSEAQIAAARRRLGPRVELLVDDLRTMGNRHRFDLVLAIEVLMHVPPSDIGAVVTKLRRLSGAHLVTLDWSRLVSRPVKAPDFLHDYRALLGPDAVEVPLGAQSLWHLG